MFLILENVVLNIIALSWVPNTYNILETKRDYIFALLTVEHEQFQISANASRARIHVKRTLIGVIQASTHTLHRAIP
jgi:hypothetical protein